MITKTDAVNMSIRRWEALVQGERSQCECGFCIYLFLKVACEGDIVKFTNDECKEYCPLAPDICINTNENLGETPLYWQWYRNHSQATAQKMLEAIKERGKKWIEEDDSRG